MIEEESKEVVGNLIAAFPTQVKSSFREPDIVKGGILRSVRGPKHGGVLQSSRNGRPIGMGGAG
jgi:hypothetical protein